MTEKERIQAIIDYGGGHLKKFKSEYRTYALCLAAVKDSAEALDYVPEKYRTEEIYQEACKHGGWVLNQVPEEYMNYEICQYAVMSYGDALKYVPEKYKNRDIYLKAVICSPESYRLVPIELLSPEFVVEVAQNSSFESIEKLPKALKNNQFYFKLMQLDSNFIWTLPKKSLTAEICKAAITSMGFETTADAIKETPKLLSRLHTSLYDHETSLAFVQSKFFLEAVGNKRYGFNTDSDDKNGRFYIYPNYSDTYSLPHMMKWEDVVRMLIKINGSFLEYAKKSIITEELCLIAIENNSRAFLSLPMKLRTKKVCNLAFQKDSSNIMAFPIEFITSELVAKAVQTDSYIITDLPDQFKTKEICLHVAKENGSLSGIPETMLDREIFLAWLRNSTYEYRPLSKIPEEMWDYDICLAAVNLDREELYRVPTNLIDARMILMATKFIPLKIQMTDITNALKDSEHSDLINVPEEELFETICIREILKSGRKANSVLQQIPVSHITQKMCNTAVEVSPLSLECIPEDYISIDIMITIARKLPGLLTTHFPDKFKNQQNIDEIVEAVPNAKDYLNRYLK